MNVTVNAGDNKGVTHIIYNIDDVFVGVSYNAPFSMSLDVSGLTPGVHHLTATAYDAAGNASQVASIDFTVAAPSTSDQGGNGSSTTTGGGNPGSGTQSSSSSSGSNSGSTGSNNNSGGSSGGGNNGGGGATPDTTSPSKPSNVTVNDPGTFFAHLSWTASTDNVSVSGYQIWRNGTLVATVTGTTYDDHHSLPGHSYSYQVIAYDAANNINAANSVGIDLAQATVFNANDTPPGDSGDGTNIEVGMKFRATQDGEITGVRFYKSAADTGTHIGNLWTTSGTNLATVTFSGESASGWQSATFSSPVHITAGTTYVVSYFAPNGHYNGSTHYFQVPHATNDYLSALQDGTDGNNGLFTVGGSSAFPTSTFHAANYWIDATFTPDNPGTFVVANSCASAPSYPDTNCTGSIGGDTMANLTGAVVLDNDNQVYSNLKVDGTIIVRGCGVTLRNIEVDAGEPLDNPVNNTPDLFPIWLQVPSNCTTTIDRVSVITKPAPNNYVTNAIRIANGGPVTVTNTRTTGTQIGILTGPGTLRDNYVELGANQRGDHNENILVDGTSDLTINHNTFLNLNSQTAGIALFTENGPNSNILVENNLLAGGGYTCYCGDGTKDGSNNPIGPPTNVSFINNVFWRKYFPDAGFFGFGRDYNPHGGGQWSGNLYMDADGTLTNQQVPQPPVAP